MTLTATCEGGCGAKLHGPYTGRAWLCHRCQASPRALPHPRDVVALGVALTAASLVAAALVGAVVAHGIYTRLTGGTPHAPA